HQEMADDVRSQFRAALEILSRLGLRLEDVRFPHPAEARAAAQAVILAEASSVQEGWVRERPGDYGPDTLDLLRQGMFLTTTQYLRAQKVSALLVGEADGLLRPYADLVALTTPVVASAISKKMLS